MPRLGNEWILIYLRDCRMIIGGQMKQSNALILHLPLLVWEMF